MLELPGDRSDIDRRERDYNVCDAMVIRDACRVGPGEVTNSEHEEGGREAERLLMLNDGIEGRETGDLLFSRRVT